MSVGFIYSSARTLAARSLIALREQASAGRPPRSGMWSAESGADSSLETPEIPPIHSSWQGFTTCSVTARCIVAGALRCVAQNSDQSPRPCSNSLELMGYFASTNAALQEATQPRSRGAPPSAFGLWGKMWTLAAEFRQGAARLAVTRLAAPASPRANTSTVQITSDCGRSPIKRTGRRRNWCFVRCMRKS